MTIKTLALGCIITSASLGAAFGQAATGTFNLASTGNDVASFSYNGTAIENITISALTKVGITTSSSNNNFRGSNWPTGATTSSDIFAGTIDLGKYIAFTVSAASGFTLDMTSISFGLGRSGTGPRQWQWRSSVDTYASAISTYTTVNASLTNTSGVLTNPDANANYTGNVLNVSGASFQGLESVTFRFYGYNSESTAGTGGLAGNLGFALVVIPEPHEYALMFAGLLGLVIVLRRVRGNRAAAVA